MVDLDLRKLPSPEKLFDLEYVVGTGTFGEVFKGRHLKTKQVVAVKILDLIEDEEEEIKVEVQVFKSFKHPNLPAFYGAFLAGPDPDSTERHPQPKLWIAMEFCELGSITDVVEDYQPKALPETIVSYVLHEVVMAVDFLHSNNVIHRDIKGQNILLTAKGEVKLVDFGVSGILSSRDEARNTYIGTPFWMAPEVIACDQQPDAVYDVRVDVWALGITAIEIADGQPPTAELHPMRALFVIPRNPPPTVKEPGKWSSEFNDFVSRCLIKDYETRPFCENLMQHPFFKDVEPKKNRIALVDLIAKVRNRSKKRISNPIENEDEGVIVQDPKTAGGDGSLKTASSQTALELDDLPDLPLNDAEVFHSHRRGKKITSMHEEWGNVAGLSRAPDPHHNTSQSSEQQQPEGLQKTNSNSNFVSISNEASQFLGLNQSSLPDATLRPSQLDRQPSLPGFGPMDFKSAVQAKPKDFARPDIRKFKKRFTSEVLCASFWGDNILLGAKNGLTLLDRGKESRVLPLLGRLKFSQIDVLSNIGVMVALCGRKNKLRAYSLPYFKQQITKGSLRGLQPYEPIESVSECLHYKIIRHERFRFLIAAQKSKITVLLWAPKPYNKFMLFKEFNTRVRPQFVDARMNSVDELQVMFASKAGFHLLDMEAGHVRDLMSAHSIPSFVPQSIMELPQDQILLLYNNKGSILDSFGDVIHDVEFDWEGSIVDTVYGHPDSVMAWSSKQVEIRSLKDGTLSGIFRHKKSTKLRFLCCHDNRVYFSVSRGGNGTQVYFMVFDGK